MALRPRRPVVEPDPVAQQQLREPMPATHQIDPHRLPRPDQIV
jgi:hypothetical protein